MIQQPLENRRATSDGGEAGDSARGGQETLERQTLFNIGVQLVSVVPARRSDLRPKHIKSPPTYKRFSKGKRYLLNPWTLIQQKGNSLGKGKSVFFGNSKNLGEERTWWIGARSRKKTTFDFRGGVKKNMVAKRAKKDIFKN